MNIRLRNTIIYGIFLLIVFLFSMTHYFGDEVTFPVEKNQARSFDGLIFDEPVNITNLTVKRSVEADQNENLYKYDIHFNYTGDPSDLRILNTPVRQIFFPEDVMASRSNATLKGEYDKVNQAIIPSLSTTEWFTKLNDSKFLAKSEIRVPLNETTNEYDFTIYTKPRELVLQNDKYLAEVGIFISNAKMGKFTDDIQLIDKDLSPKTTTKEESGIYINALEIVNDSVAKSLNRNHNVGMGLFIISVIMVLATIWINRPQLMPLRIVGMFLTILSFAPFLNKGVSNMAAIIILPVLTFIGYVLTKLFGRRRFVIKANDLKQALGISLIFLLVSVLVFIVPRGL